MNMNKKGFVNIVLIIVIVAIVVVGGYFVLRSDTNTASQLSPTPGIRTTGGAGGIDDLPQFPDGSITLLSPNGGETYKVGGQITVKWQTKNVSSASGIWIHLDTADGKHLDNGGDLVTSWNDAPNNGEKTVTIPVDVPDGQYKVAVTVGQELEDTSDNYITITSGKPLLNQEQARALILQTWGGCTPDTCESVTVTAVQDISGQYTVTAIYEGLRDDSVSAQKKVAPAFYSNNIWSLGKAEVTQRCQPGRGHQDFSSAPCF